MLIQHLFNINLIFQQSDEAFEQLRTSAAGSNNSSWGCILRFYPYFATEPRFATGPLVLQTVSRFATNPNLVTEPRFATVPRGTVLRNMRIWCGNMWWVWCNEMCGYGASKWAGMLWSAGMVRRSAAMMRRNGDEMATTSDDRSTWSNYICQQLRFLFQKLHFKWWICVLWFI